ncbi:MAG: hypothetical protein KAU20_07955 [Nanoarchaeota archaeon]|nr:hypothetical protein [Nanoarchaeota archaeon]
MGLKIDETKGYWINSLNNQTLTIQGTEPNNITFDLNQGWNLIGYPSLETKPINETLNVSQISSVFAYINQSWKSYSPDKPDYLNTLKYFIPGYGYWVKVK